MYRCELCKTLVPAGTKCCRLVVKTRERRYPARDKANKFRRTEQTNKGPRSKVKEVGDPGGVGREIAREVSLCARCASSLTPQY